MNILPYEKIEANFTPWQPEYINVANLLIKYIQTDKLAVIHIGSTSCKVGGKGIIDLAVLYQEGDLKVAVEQLISLGFQDQISSNPFPIERPRKDGSVIYNNKKYCLHVHVIQAETDEHQKLIRYKTHMLTNPSTRQAYEATKKEILASGVTEQEKYGKLKSPFVKSTIKNIND